MDFGIVSVTGVAFLTFSVLAIAAVGYTLGRITIKGVNLGTAGVFIVALLFGAFLFPVLDDQLMVGDEAVSFTKEALKIIENLCHFGRLHRRTKVFQKYEKEFQVLCSFGNCDYCFRFACVCTLRAYRRQAHIC